MVRRRLLILSAVLVFVCCAAGGAYVWRQRQIRGQFARHRSDGLAAAASGDNLAALIHLSPYLNRHPDDREVLVAFCKVRPLVQEPDGRHLIETINALRQLLTLEPERAEERRALLRLYVNGGYAAETVDTAEALLRRSSGDREALRAQTDALIRLQRNPEALLVAQRWSQAAPNDVRAEMTVLLLMHDVLKNDAEVVRRADARLLARPDDGRAELCAGFARALTGDAKGAGEHFKAATRNAPAAAEPAFYRELVWQLDKLGLFDESLAALRQCDAKAGATPDPEVKQRLARRLWELGRWSDASDLLVAAGGGTPGADPAAAPASEQLLGMRGVAATVLDRKQDLTAVRASLTLRGTEAATAWLAVLDSMTPSGEGVSDPGRVVEPCQRALPAAQAGSAGPAGDPYLRYFLGDTEARLGENELALTAWRQSAEQVLTWPLPLIRMAHLLADTGRYAAAVQAAQEAARRAPENSGAVIALVRAWVGGIQTGQVRAEGGGQVAEELLAMADAVQKQLPGEDQTLCARVDLLAGSEGKREEAKAALSAALAAEPPPSAAALLKLASISRRWRLGLEFPCLDAADRVYGPGPDAALARALYRSEEGHTAEAGRDLEAACRQGASGPGGPAATRPADSEAAVAWTACRARFLDASGDARARAAVVALADAHPASLSAQRAALAARSTAGDGEFLERTMMRVLRLTGEQGIGWRLVRGRVLLDASPDDGPAAADAARDAAREAARVLQDVLHDAPGSAEARVLLARAFQAVGDAAGAERQLAEAADLSADVGVRLSLARLLQSHGDPDGCRRELARAAAQPGMSGADRKQVAMLLAEQGDDPRAIALLEGSARGGATTLPAAEAISTVVDALAGDEQSALLLADLYRRSGRADRVDAACEKMLGRPTVPGVAFAARWFAGRGRGADAERALALLDAAGVTPARKSLVLADHAARFSGPRAALPLYEAATRADPSDEGAWRKWIACQLAAGRGADAAATAAAAAAALPGNRSLSDIRARADWLAAAGANPQLLAAAAAFVDDPSSDAAPAQVLKACFSTTVAGPGATAATGPAAMALLPAAERMKRLAALSNRFPAYPLLQGMLVQAAVEAGRPAEAVKLATALTRMFPQSGEAYARLGAAQAAAGDWAAAAASAGAWRERAVAAGESPVNADVAAAAALIRQGRAREAAALLAPYRDRALADPDAFPGLAATYTAAEAKAGEEDAATEARLEPLLAQGPEGRKMWIAFAASTPDRAKAADRLRRAAARLPAQPEQAVDERLLLTAAWVELSARTGDKQYARLGRDVIAPLTGGAAPPPDAVLALGVCFEQEADYGAAEAAYRRALELRPQWVAAQNNLAVVLAKQVAKDGGAATAAGPAAGRLSEALRLARAAAEAEPRAAACQDTLAMVYRQQREYAKAVAAMREAVRLEPGQLRYKVRLARLMADAGSPRDAAALVKEVDAALSRSPGGGEAAGLVEADRSLLDTLR